MTDPDADGRADGADRPDAVDEELDQVLADAAEKISELRAELRALRQAEQHAEIGRLEEYLATTNVRWAEVRHFFSDALAELRGREREPGDAPESREASGNGG